MTAATPAKPKVKRRDAYIARVTISIPLNMADPDSLPKAIKAVADIKDKLPADATVKIDAGLGKI